MSSMATAIYLHFGLPSSKQAGLPSASNLANKLDFCTAGFLVKMRC